MTTGMKTFSFLLLTHQFCFTFDSSVLPLYRPRWGWCENAMGTLMFGNVEGTLCGQTGAGGWAGGQAGWVDEAGKKTHLWRGVLEPWSCYGVDIENLFCLGLRRVGFHLGEREWQNREILFGRQSVSLSALPSQEWIWKGGEVGMAMKSVWRVGGEGSALLWNKDANSSLNNQVKELQNNIQLFHQSFVLGLVELTCGWDYIMTM